jgi:hypothetical protein
MKIYNRKIEFAQSKIDIFIAKMHLPIACFGFLFSILLESFGILSKGQKLTNVYFPDGSLTVVLPILFISVVLFRFITTKFAYKLVFDNLEKSVSVTKYHKKGKTTYKLDDLETVQLRWFTIFCFKGGDKVHYRGDESLLKFLISSDFHLSWNFWGKLFSPNIYKEFKRNTS